MLWPWTFVLILSAVYAVPTPDEDASSELKTGSSVSCQSYDPIEGHAYMFQNRNSYTYLDLEDGAIYDGTKVQGYTYASPGYINNQLWRARLQGQIGNDCVWTLQNVASGTYLSLPYGDSSNGARVQTWTRSSIWDDDHWWIFSPTINGVQTLKNWKSGTCLELFRGSADLQTPADGWACIATNNQRWFVYDSTFLIE